MSDLAKKSPTPALENELAVIREICGLLDVLHPACRQRVLAWVMDVFGDQKP
jgi:hypothetical protein